MRVQPVQMCSCCGDNNYASNYNKKKPSPKKNTLKFKDVLEKEIERNGKSN